jgi:hypothetical protein
MCNKDIGDTPHRAGWDNIDYFFNLLVLIIQGSVEATSLQLCYNLLNEKYNERGANQLFVIQVKW